MRLEAPLLVRADADARIATGHVMRCLALAQAWRAAGGDAAYLSRCEPPELRVRVAEAGVDLAALKAPHPDPDDLEATLRTLDRLRQESSERPWLVVDGYHFDEAYQKGARGAGFRLLVVDDHAHLPRYQADILFNQSLHAEALSYPVNADALQLLGPTFALLRPEFLAAAPFAGPGPRRGARPRGKRPPPREIAETARKILITLGGADAGNVTLKALRAVQALEIPRTEAIVVVGAGNPHLAELQGAAAGGRTSIRLLRNPPDMPELMAWADVAVAAGGSTSWELAYMGLPSVMLALAENQRGVAAALDRAGAAVGLGDAAAVATEALRDALSALCRDPDRRRSLGEKGRGLVDGRGAERTVRIMRALGESPIDEALEVRPARPADACAIWRLSNDPSVRANSFSRDPIPLPRHLEWYAARLADGGTRFWVLTLADAVVGQIRYARAENESSRRSCAEVHFSVSAALRGKGLGTLALQRTLAPALRELRVRRVRGVVLPPNEASLRAFLKAGFQRLPDAREKGRLCWVFEMERVARSLAS